MKLELKPARFNAHLPAVPCTAEFRARIVQIAENENVSLAQIQRTALNYFVSLYENKEENAESTNIDSI